MCKVYGKDVLFFFLFRPTHLDQNFDISRIRGLGKLADIFTFLFWYFLKSSVESHVIKCHVISCDKTKSRNHKKQVNTDGHKLVNLFSGSTPLQYKLLHIEQLLGLGLYSFRSGKFEAAILGHMSSLCSLCTLITECATGCHFPQGWEFIPVV